jgi:hypothetical protein
MMFGTFDRRSSGGAAIGHLASHGRRVGAAVVNRDACGHVVTVDRALEQAPRRSLVAVNAQQEVLCLAELVDGAALAFPQPAHRRIGFVHTPG